MDFPGPGHFLAFTLKFGGRASKLITEIQISEAYDPTSPPNPPPKAITTNALWDTGATGTFLSPSTISALGIAPVGVADVKHGGGERRSKTYVVNIALPNRVGMVGVVGTELADFEHGFGAIVGMDIISQGDLAITNFGGNTCMSFRIPSCEQIDYVAQADKKAKAGIGRNDMCPCGSGKKFKKCHLRSQ